MAPECLSKALSLSRASVEGLKLGLGTGEHTHKPSQHLPWATWNLKVTLCPVPKMWIKVPLKRTDHVLSAHPQSHGQLSVQSFVGMRQCYKRVRHCQPFQGP